MINKKASYKKSETDRTESNKSSLVDLNIADQSNEGTEFLNKMIKTHDQRKNRRIFQRGKNIKIDINSIRRDICLYKVESTKERKKVGIYPPPANISKTPKITNNIDKNSGLKDSFVYDEKNKDLNELFERADRVINKFKKYKVTTPKDLSISKIDYPCFYKEKTEKMKKKRFPVVVKVEKKVLPLENDFERKDFKEVEKKKKKLIKWGFGRKFSDSYSKINVMMKRRSSNDSLNNSESRMRDVLKRKKEKNDYKDS